MFTSTAEKFNDRLGFTLFALIAPLERFAALQRLNLAPSSRLLPNYWALVPFSSTSPLSMLWSSQKTFGGYMKTFASSPAVLLWLLFLMKSWVDERLYVLIGNALPKPTGPTRESREAASNDDLTEEHILGLCEPDDPKLTSYGFWEAGYAGIRARLARWARAQMGYWTNGAEDQRELLEMHRRAISDSAHRNASTSRITSPSMLPSPDLVEQPELNPSASEAPVSDVRDDARLGQSDADATQEHQTVLSHREKRKFFPQLALRRPTI